MPDKRLHSLSWCLSNVRILLANPQVPKCVCPTCLQRRQKIEQTSPRKSTPRTLQEVGQQYLMSQGSPPRISHSAPPLDDDPPIFPGAFCARTAESNRGMLSSHA